MIINDKIQNSKGKKVKKVKKYSFSFKKIKVTKKSIFKKIYVNKNISFFFVKLKKIEFLIIWFKN